jgi:hypothetical protein
MKNSYVVTIFLRKEKISQNNAYSLICTLKITLIHINEMSFKINYKTHADYWE